ncbi:AbrB/MazE/SpoVT family DNA-binding domain-containing protein, partial [Campylobacter volucris]|uniref:AbrB/MazE/SpoVT family DNA-binding domain-containing protein n=1 Tax=Campylobacter volucris TaxID=1031542 RepID=UPI00189DE6A3
KWGNSVGLRMPTYILKELNITCGQQVDISVDNGNIIIKPINNYKLMELINQITPENIHSEISVGSEVGNEII